MSEGWDIEKAIQDIKRRCHRKPSDKFKSDEDFNSDDELKSEHSIETFDVSEFVETEIMPSPSPRHSYPVFVPQQQKQHISQYQAQTAQFIPAGGKLFQAIPINKTQFVISQQQPMTVQPKIVHLVKPDGQVVSIKPDGQVLLELQEQQQQQQNTEDEKNNMEHIFYIGRSFTSHKDLCKAKSMYEQRHKIILSIRNSQTILNDYKRCNRKNTNYNTELEYTDIAYHCRFSWKFETSQDRRKRKRKENSSELDKTEEPKKERNTTSMSTECPFSIKLHISKDNQSLLVVKFQEEHNHISCPSMYNKVRQKLDEETLEETKMLLAHKVDNNKIQRYLCSKGKMIRKKELFNLSIGVKKNEGQQHLYSKDELFTMKDVHNLMMNEDKGSNSFEDVLALLMNHHDISFEMMITKESVCGGIFFQTEDMKLIFDISSEMVVFDTTYKLEEHRMSLYVILCLDGNGESVVIALALVQYENKETLSWIAESFRKYNSNFTKVKYVVVDKDMLERQELLNYFPNAQLLNCQFFYTLKTFKKEVTTTKMNISAEERDFSLEMFQNIVSAKNKATRDSNITLLEEMAPDEVVVYFTNKWEPFKDDWARGISKMSTINTLEIFSGRLKKFIETYSSVTQFVTDLLILNWEHKWKRNQRAFKNFNQTSN